MVASYRIQTKREGIWLHQAQKNTDAVTCICIFVIEWDRPCKRSTRKERLKSGRFLQVYGAAFAVLVFDFIADLLTFLKAAEAGAFNGRNVNKHIIAALIRCDKPIAFGRVKPFNSSGLHFVSSPLIRKHMSHETGRGQANFAILNVFLAKTRKMSNKGAWAGFQEPFSGKRCWSDINGFV
jgi:hypothetical protein